MSVPKSYKGIIKLFEQQPAEVRRYFQHLPALVSGNWPYDVALAYMFGQVERAHRRALYCGITKRFAADSRLVHNIVRKEYLTREKFRDLFGSVFSHSFPNVLTERMKHAQDMRDFGIHGQETSDREMRRAIHDVFQYARDFNNLALALGGFKPFGDLRGFKGRGGNLPRETTRWLLKGMGFSVR